MKSEITIYNYISHKKVDIRQRNKMMVEKGNFQCHILRLQYRNRNNRRVLKQLPKERNINIV